MRGNIRAILPAKGGQGGWLPQMLGAILMRATVSGFRMIRFDGRGISMRWEIREIANPLALHGIFDSRDRAEHHLREVIPNYVARGYFMDKSLTADSFQIVEKPGRG